MKWLILLIALPLNSLAKSAPDNTLVLSNSHSWAPMSYMEEGEAKGILVDFWKLYGKYNEQPVAFRMANWGESIDAVREGKAQVHAGLLKSPERKEFFIFSRSIFPLVTGLFVSLDKRIEAEKLAIPIGIISQSYEEEYMRTNHPDVDLVFFKNSRELVQAARDKLIDAFVTELLTGMYFIREFGEEKRLVFDRAFYSKQLHVAVTPENQDLLDEIQKGIDRIPKHQVRELLEARRPLPDEKRLLELPWQVLRATVILLIVGLIWWAVKSLFSKDRRNP